MGLARIDHIEFIVRDLNESETFLNSLGFETVRRTMHHGGAIEVKLPGEFQPLLEIHKVKGDENPGRQIQDDLCEEQPVLMISTCEYHFLL